jgi:hypothetical protein
MDLIPAGLIVHRTCPGDVEVMVPHNVPNLTFASKHMIENGKLFELEMYSAAVSWNPDDVNFTIEYVSTIDMSCLTDAEKKKL